MNNMKVIKKIAVLIIILLAACDQYSSDSSQLNGEESEYGQTKNVGGYSFYIELLNEHMTQIASSDMSIISRNEQKKEEGNLLRFSLKLSGYDRKKVSRGSDDVKKVQSDIYFFSYHFGKDIFVETESSERIPVALFHFERSYDLTSSKSFVFGFDKELVQDGQVKLVVDSDYLNTGPVKFKFDLARIKNI